MENNSNPLVLLVDDNDTDNLIAKRLLELTGFSKQIHICNSGIAAIEWLTFLLAQKEPMPELIFLDINMPLMDGFTFLDAFEHLYPQLPKSTKIVILSSSDNQADIERMMKNVYVCGFITKPLTSEALKLWLSTAPANNLRMTG